MQWLGEEGTAGLQSQLQRKVAAAGAEWLHDTTMGIEYSTEAHQHIPLTGAPNTLEVIKGSGKYVKKDVVILKLRENGLNYR